MKVHELMTTSPMTCRPADSLHEAAQRLWNEDCGSLPVVDGRNRLVGIVTDRDIAMAGYLRNRRLSEIRVADTMSRQITTCDRDEDVKVAIERMRETRVRRLPVCDGEGTLHGMLAFGDLLQAATRSKTIAEPVLDALATISTPRGEKAKVLEPQPKGSTPPQGSQSGSTSRSGGTPASTTASQPASTAKAVTTSGAATSSTKSATKSSTKAAAKPVVQTKKKPTKKKKR